jgi:hypothetical protein
MMFSHPRMWPEFGPHGFAAICFIGKQHNEQSSTRVLAFDCFIGVICDRFFQPPRLGRNELISSSDLRPMSGTSAFSAG